MGVSLTNQKCVLISKNMFEEWPETHFKAVKCHEFSDMSPNLVRQGRDPGQLGKCPNFPVFCFEGFHNQHLIILYRGHSFSLKEMFLFYEHYIALAEIRQQECVNN